MSSVTVLARLARDFNLRIVQTIPRNHAPGRRSHRVLHEECMVLESEEESTVLMDCCFYDWIREGKSLSKIRENHPPAPGTENTDSSSISAS